MKIRIGIPIAMACILSLFPGAPGARAESDEYAVSAGDEGIPPWSVARLKAIEGSAWLLAPGESDWEEVDGNAPLPKGARIRVPDEASADIEFSSGNRVRLRAGADLELRDLREERISMTLYEGKAAFRLPEDDSFIPVNVTLPDGQIVRFPKAGRYGIEAAGIGEESVVRVYDGEARIKVEEAKFRVRAGEEAYVGEGVSIGRLSDAGAVDDDPPPPPLTGVERSVEAPPTVVNELRDYGEWVDAPSYGAVWRPRVAVGWSPYTYGRWVWVSSFGWSWVSSEPWGWYPYRCGNWIDDPFFGWIWTPYRSFASVSLSFGHRSWRANHYYPATVRFVRESGNVRWVPLRPGERFSRPAVSRTERTLTSWRQPIPRQTVFVREPGGRGGEPTRWRDAHVERTARPAAVRPAPVVRPAAPAIRTAPADRPTKAVRPIQTPRRDSDTVRPGSGNEGRFRERGSSAPVKQVEPPRERGSGAFAPAPVPPRERPEVRTAPRPEVRAVPERVAPRPEPVIRERAGPSRAERPDRTPRGDGRGRDNGGDRDSGRGGRGGR